MTVKLVTLKAWIILEPGLRCPSAKPITSVLFPKIEGGAALCPLLMPWHISRENKVTDRSYIGNNGTF